MKTKKPESSVESEKWFKKVSRLYRDKQWVKFVFSIEFRFNGLPTKVISISECRADGDSSPCFSRDRNSDVLPSRKALKGGLASIEERVHEYVEKNALGAHWKKLEGAFDEALKSGVSVDDLEYQCATPIQALAASSYEAHFSAPLMAMAHAKAGAKALAENNLDEALYCVDRGLYWSSPAMFISNPHERFKARASTGGRGKDLRFEPVKDKVAELLKELAPDEGWKNSPTAIKAVVDELIDSHSNFVEECLLKPETLPRTIRDWISRDPERFTHRIKPKARWGSYP
jgi:hypothetical protein